MTHSDLDRKWKHELFNAIASIHIKHEDNDNTQTIEDLDLTSVYETFNQMIESEIDKVVQQLEGSYNDKLTIRKTTQVEYLFNQFWCKIKRGR